MQNTNCQNQPTFSQWHKSLRRNLPAYFFVLLAALTPALAKEKVSQSPVAVIEGAVSASDVWSAGNVHLRASIKFMQVKPGTIDAQYEKIWISPRQWRSQFSSAEFSRTLVGGDGQIWSSATAPDTPLRVWQFDRALASLSQVIVSKDLKYVVHQRVRNKAKDKMTCVEVSDAHRNLVQDCVDPDTGVLLLVNEGMFTYLYSDYAPLKGKLFPRTVTVVERDSVVVVINITELETLAVADSKGFEAPLGVKPIKACPSALGLPLGAAGGKLVNHVMPRPRGVMRDTNDIVLLSAVLGRDGRLHNVEAFGSNPFTKAAAIEAAQLWQYEPFTVCEAPVEMPANLTMNFSAGR